MSWKFPAIFFALFLGLSAVIGAMNQADKPQPQVATKAPPDTLPAGMSRITEDERKFISAAGSYLAVANKYDMEVAQAMAGLNDATTTLSDVEREIHRAVDRQRGAYGATVMGDPPPSMLDLAREVDEVNRLHESAYRELLAYWDNGSIDHIVSGQATLKRAVLATNAAIEHMTARMKTLSP